MNQSLPETLSEHCKVVLSAISMSASAKQRLENAEREADEARKDIAAAEAKVASREAALLEYLKQNRETPAPYWAEYSSEKTPITLHSWGDTLPDLGTSAL